jgi:hypothetical protein
MKIAIRACGYADETGFGGSRTGFVWQPVAESERRWKHVSDAPYDRFGRLDPLSKYTLVAAEMLGLPALPPEPHPAWALCSATREGCLSVDAEFLRGVNRTGAGSPSLFPYTLPSSGMAEVAIRYRITGPNVCLIGGTDCAFEALREGCLWLQERAATSCVCLIGDAVSPDAGACLRRPAGCAAAAFLLEAVFAADEAPLPLAVIESTPVLPEAASPARANAQELYAFLRGADGLDPLIFRPHAAGSSNSLTVRRVATTPGSESL